MCRNVGSDSGKQKRVTKSVLDASAEARATTTLM